MICMHDGIACQRVLSKDYEFHYSLMRQYLEDFLQRVSNLGAHPDGSLFYALNNVPMDEVMKATFFVPLKEEIIAPPDMNFHSYFSVEKMMSVCVRDGFETRTEEAYTTLFHLMSLKKLRQTTPPFHVIERTGDRFFLIVKVGYQEEEPFGEQ